MEKMSPRQLTHAMELLSEALVGMRTAPDPRVDLTLALVRLSRSDLDTHPSTLAARVERLEAAVAELGAALGAAGGAASGAEAGCCWRVCCWRCCVWRRGNCCPSRYVRRCWDCHRRDFLASVFGNAFIVARFPASSGGSPPF